MVCVCVCVCVGGGEFWVASVNRRNQVCCVSHTRTHRMCTIWKMMAVQLLLCTRDQGTPIWGYSR